MKAKVTPRIRTKDRTPLQEVIPLKTPFHIFIDPSAACNFSCKFCFNRNKGKTFHKIMDFELFKKAVDDLKQFPDKLKVLRLYKEGEPLLNKHLPEMIEYAKKSGVCESVDFTTNGSLLTPEKNIKLISAGLDAIIISVEGITSEKYKEISGVEINFEQFVENIRHFYKNKGNCRLHIKTTDANVPEKDQEEYFNIFGDISDEISIDRVTPIWPDISMDGLTGSLERGIYNQVIEPVNVCPYIFYSLTINSDGSVSSCFIDWQHSNIVGDINERSIFDIWHGRKLYELRKAHLKRDKSSYPICVNCGQLVYGMADNIDNFSEELLNKLERL